ncbi:MAG TPA: DUF1800 domain-containing protein [Stellaceae bacterium]|jgi:hypothetical protein
MSSRYAGLLGAACLLLLLLPMRAGAADSDRQVIHVLNRLAFGPTLDDFNYVKLIGVERYVAEQLEPEAIDEPIELRFRLAQLTTLGLGAVELRGLYGPLRPVAGVKPSVDEIRAQQARARLVVREAAEARILKAVLSRRQLQQVMVNFWFNHFNIFSGKGLDRVWIGNYEDQAIRPHALGRFRDLLLAVAQHPAMLVYLDNTEDAAPGSPGARGAASGLNENFAREVMELHTLGVNGGYTQGDVVTLARVLTGWRVNPPGSEKFPEVAAIFDGTRHDYSPKVFLGRKLDARGRAEGEEALDILASSPATAHHIAYELAQYFVADAPPPALVDRLAARFLATGGDIRQVLQTLFASPEFWDSAGQKYKTPYEYVISAVRAAGVPVNNLRPLIGWMSRFGMPLYGCQTPDGYANTQQAWLSPNAAIQRVSFAIALAGGGLPIGALPVGGEDGAALLPHRPDPIDPAPLEEIFGASLSRSTRAAVEAAPGGLRAALIFGSPDFMRR